VKAHGRKTPVSKLVTMTKISST